MSRRLYFLVPDIVHTRQIVQELLLNHVEERHIHVMAKEGTPLEDLPEAGVLQRSDVVKALERGAGLGGATGLLAGLAAVTFPPAGLVLGGGAVLLTTLAGAGIGAWASALIGASVPNSELQRFEKALQEGQVLMLVDVPANRVGEVTDLIKKHHPEADVAGTDPTWPPFP
jgi:hypothetical protein